ncbi:Putrescine ABC transporter putrescine-binding protein PotF (TC 3.A.1.11.2) [hydrothermal vent metagenome]|uniref:Putrescine ABC transporter putrescine-binding protein PotF (TC 3.A.1.11.2) n=1 Tax=hydrothermal vent metagenome TaxID=652676 RepID=A0A3B0TXJ9_9ZZZZ
MNKAILAIAVALLGTTSAIAQSKVVNIYNWSDYIAEDTIAKFEAATGIKVVYDVYDSNEVLEAKMLTGNSGYDVVVPTSDFLQRQIAAGAYQKLDKSKLPNLVNMDPELMKGAAAYDPGNQYATIYMWGTTGIGYNVKAIEERLGKDYKVNSWDLVFNPEIVAKLADCGVSFLDAPTEMIPAAMNYLGLDPNSTVKADLEAGAALLESVRPSIRYFHSSQYINDLANGDTCVAVGWSGDVFQARARAEEAGNGVEVGYIIPKEGALQWFDMMAIPVDAPHPDAALKFINFIMDPQITADITNYVWYANANKASMPLVDPEITSDPGIFPSEEAKKNLWASTVYNARTDRIITRLWTKVKTGI